MEASKKISELEEKLCSALALIDELSKRVEELESALASKNIKKTSNNSHLPPSKDLTSPSKKNRSLRKKSDDPVGGQKGHKGTTLQMSDTPDQVVDLHSDYCEACGNSLSEVPIKWVGRRQVIDIPPIVPVTTEYRLHERICSCGHCQVPNYPEGVDNHVQYGPNLQSMVIYQNVYQYMPFQRLQGFFDKIMGVCLSKGTLENILRRSAKKAEGTYEKLRQVVEVSFFVGSDETGAKLKGKKMWFWVWQSAVVTYILAACSRSKKVIEETFPEGFPDSILGSDRLAAQLSTVSKGNQVCLAHLLRDLNYLIEVEKTQWATDFKQVLKDAIALKNMKGHYRENDPKVVDIEARADALLGQSFQELNWSKAHQHKSMTFFKGMRKVRPALFTFLYHRLVPADNNSSERAIRPIKVKMKISGQFKSLQQEFAILRSVIDTAIKNGQPVFNAIQAIVQLPRAAG